MTNIQVTYKVFCPGNALSKEPQEKLRTEKREAGSGTGVLSVEEVWGKLHPTNTSWKDSQCTFTRIREQDWHKDTSVILFILPFPNLFYQALFSHLTYISIYRKVILLVWETNAGNVSLSNCLYFAMATATGKGMGAAWGVLLRHLFPFVAKDDSWLNQLPPLPFSPTPSQKDYLIIYSEPLSVGTTEKSNHPCWNL